MLLINAEADLNNFLKYADPKIPAITRGAIASLIKQIKAKKEMVELVMHNMADTAVPAITHDPNVGPCHKLHYDPEVLLDESTFNERIS